MMPKTRLDVRSTLMAYRATTRYLVCAMFVFAVMRAGGL